MSNKIIESIKKWFKKETLQPLEKGKKPEKDAVKNRLRELCGDDTRLYEVLSSFLYEKPLMAISKKDLDTLIEDAKKSGNFKMVADKAIFEASQNLGEKERYIKIIRDLAPTTIEVLEKEKEKAKKEVLADHTAILSRRIENQKFISERVEDVLNIASKYYKEKLDKMEEDARKEAVKREAREAEGRDWRLEREMDERREARKKTKMSSAERREAEEQDDREKSALEKRKKAREEEKRKSELEKNE